METKNIFHVGTALCLIAFLVFTSGCSHPPSTNTSGYSYPPHLKVDDWEYAGGGIVDRFSSYTMKTGSIGSAPMMATAESVGFSVGGAKDINNFRENIRNGYFPILTDITYEGLFYDYYFDTGEEERCNDLFCPSYSYAISKDPVSDEEEYYLSVGLNSGIEDFSRKKLNLVVVLDISGSMGSSFNRYYYDQLGNAGEQEEDEDAGKTKMEIANEAVAAMLGHLDDGDSFGMVVFDNEAYLAKPLSNVGQTDMDDIKDHILELYPRGGTNMAAGMRLGTELFDEYAGVDKAEYENRIIFLTDAMPNIGDTSENGLLGMAKSNALRGIYSTFIGIGVDFNTELVEHITKIKGANYYSVHSSQEFKKRMDDEFEYMVTPLVFDLKLELETDGYEIEKVYGSPEADEATGEIMRVNTLFPSAKTEEGTRGGVVILKLRKLSDDAEISLEVSYEDREGNRKSKETEVEIRDKSPDYYQNTGIRKAILLSRHATLMKDWIIDEREHRIVPLVNHDDGIVVPDEEYDIPLGRWERQSVELTVSRHYREIFAGFAEYFEGEMDAIGDDSLEKELELIEKLSNY